MSLLKNKILLRRLHRQLAPIMILPVLMTLFTGMAFELAVKIDKTDDFLWLLEWHRGNFKVLNFEEIYPFFNAFGLFILAISGISLWWQNNFKKKKVSRDN
jgi:cytochrome b subunit of formate dehydrogenase